MEAMGAAFTTISYTSVAGGQGGSSDLQRFRVHHPLTSEGGGGGGGGGGPNGDWPLVPAGRESFGGYGDYL